MIVQIATLGPLGRLKAPGTWGSAAGLLWWALVVRLAHAKGARTNSSSMRSSS